MNRKQIAYVIALVLFAVGLVLNLVASPVDAEVAAGLLFGGLAALAAGLLL